MLKKAKFLIVPVSSKSRADELTQFEVELLAGLAHYCKEGQCYEDRVRIVGPVHKKASFVLVRKGLAAYVKDVLYPSAVFHEVFMPLLEESEGSTTHSKIESTYDKFISLR